MSPWDVLGWIAVVAFGLPVAVVVLSMITALVVAVSRRG